VCAPAVVAALSRRIMFCAGMVTVLALDFASFTAHAACECNFLGATGLPNRGAIHAARQRDSRCREHRGSQEQSGHLLGRQFVQRCHYQIGMWLQLCRTASAGNADRSHTGGPGGDEPVNRVLDDDAAGRRDAQRAGTGQERLGVWLAVARVTG